jgi:hypothetical protein
MDLLDELNGFAAESTWSPVRGSLCLASDFLFAKGIISIFLSCLVWMYFPPEDIVKAKLSWEDILQKVNSLTPLCGVCHPLQNVAMMESEFDLASRVQRRPGIEHSAPHKANGTNAQDALLSRIAGRSPLGASRLDFRQV